MTNQLYDGFRFKHVRKNLNMPNGKLKVHIIAVARNLDEAFALADDLLPVQGLRLIGNGPDVLNAARLVHLKEGEAKVL